MRIGFGASGEQVGKFGFGEADAGVGGAVLVHDAPKHGEVAVAALLGQQIGGNAASAGNADGFAAMP